MARLPQPGADRGTWGDVLNEFLSQSLKFDGTIKDNAVTANTIAPNAVTSAALASNAVTAAIIQDGTITEALLDTGLKAKVNAGNSVASVSGKTGSVVLDKSDVGLSNVDNTSDSAKNSAVATLTNKTLSDPRITNIHDTNGNEMLAFVPAANAANHLQFYNAASGGEVAIRAAGDDTNINFVLRAKGTGSIVFRDSSNIQIASFAGATSAVNRFVFTSSASGNALSMQAAGTDTDVSINIIPRGAGTLQSKGIDVVTVSNTQTLSAKTLSSPRISGAILDGNGNSLLSVGATSNAVNYLYISNQASGSAPGFTAIGADTNIGMSFAPKGAGAVSIWTAAGNTPTLASAGQDTNQDLALLPKGAGIVKLGGGAAIPQGGVLGFYNTSDQATNYERARLFWQSNVFIIDGSEASGTGTQRSMVLRAQGKALTIAGPGGIFDMAVTTSGNGAGLRVQGTNTASSGMPVGIGLVRTMNQTATAGYTGLSMNITEAATGSGAKFLIDAQVGGSSKFKVDTNGKVTLGNGPSISTGTGSPEGVVTAPIGSLYTRTDGVPGSTLYVKESGTGATGWTAK